MDPISATIASAATIITVASRGLFTCVATMLMTTTSKTMIATSRNSNQRSILDLNRLGVIAVHIRVAKPGLSSKHGVHPNADEMRCDDHDDSNCDVLAYYRNRRRLLCTSNKVTQHGDYEDSPGDGSHDRRP